MNWEIHTYGGGDFLRLVFTAIASIFNNGDYFMAMKIVALATFVGIMVKVAFSKDGAQNFRYMMVLVFFIYVAILPKATMLITDSVNPANSAVVANVPLGVAAVAGTASAFGWWATQAMETTFSNPLAKPTTTGFLFHSSMMDAVNKVVITDPRTATNYRSFFASCVIVDGIGHDRFSWSDMLNAPDIDQFFKTKVTAGVAGFYYFDAAGSRTFQMCKAGYNTLSNDITGGIPQAIKQISIPWAAEYGGVANASGMLNTQLAPTVNALTGGTGTKDSITRQYMLKNSLDASLASMAAELNDENAEKYVINKANYERTLTFSAVGKVAADKMPLLRTILEGVIYALSPLIILFAIISPWQVSVAYAKALIWISLWAPMFAILHFARSYFDIANLVEVSKFYGGTSPNAIGALNNYMSEASNITGYLMGGLPVICWLIISNSGAMLASFAGRAGDGFEKSVTKEVGDVVAGQGTVGGKTWQETQASHEGMNGAMQSQSAGSLPAHGGAQVTSTMDNGTQITTRAGGYDTINQAASNMLVSQQGAVAFTNATQAQTQQTKAYEESTAQKATDATSALLAQTQGAVHKASTDLTNSSTDRASQTHAIETGNTQTNSGVDQWGKTQNYSAETLAQIKASVAPSAFGMGGGVAGGTSSSRGEVEQATHNFMQSNIGQQAIRASAQTVMEGLKSSSGSVGDESTRGISSALNVQKTATEEHSVAQKAAFNASQMESMARQNTESITTKNDDQMMHYAQKHLGYSGEEGLQRYDKMLHDVAGHSTPEAQQAAQREYGAILKATNHNMGSDEEVKAQFATDGQAIDRLGSAKLKEADRINQGDVAHTHQANDSKVHGKQVANDGVATNESPTANNPLPAVDPNFGRQNQHLQNEVNPAGRSVVDGVDGETTKAVDSGLSSVGQRVVNNVVDGAVAVNTGYHAVKDFAEAHNPFEGNPSKK